MNKGRWTYLFFILTLMMSLPLGCGDGASTTSEKSAAPNPIDVKVKADEKLASSAIISTKGGTLTAQSADGTKFTLTFPKDALLSDEKITLTPAAPIDGLPFSGAQAGAVQLAPEGLRLLQSATLTIESPKNVAATGYETVAYAYHQNGEGLYLNPSRVKDNLLTLEVWHFSGAGASQGTPTEIQTQQQQHVPSNAEDAFTQRMQEFLGRERQAQLLGQSEPDPDFGKKMGEFTREAYDSFIGPQLPIALEDCAAAPAILSRALGWLRQVQLLGNEEEFQAESELITETLNTAIVNCYDKEYDQCVIDNDIKHRTAMLGLLRQASLLGVDDRLDQSKIEKCPRGFSVDQSYGDGGHVSGKICSLSKPFTLQTSASVGYPGEFRFTPTDDMSGTFTFEATFQGAPVTSTGSGTYKVEGLGIGEGKPVIRLDGSGVQNTMGAVTAGYPIQETFVLLPGAGCTQ